MFNLENAIQNWKRRLRSNSAFEDGDIAELEAHLREEVVRLKAEGMSEEEAFAQASEEIGEPEDLGQELYKTRTTKRDATPPWQQASWIPALLPNYLKIALRNLQRNKIYAGINILGLVVGVACCVLLLLYIQYHLSFDNHYPQAEQVYRITAEVESETNNEIRNMVYIPGSWGPGLVREFPNISSFTRFFRYRADIIMHYEEDDNQFYERNFYWADSTVFDVLGYPMIRGNPDYALNRPNTLVITEEIARKYFGEDDPMGKTINYINGETLIAMEVTGVMEDIPAQSHFQPEFIASVSTIANRWWIQDYDRMESWQVPFWVTYLRLDGNEPVTATEQKINSFLDRQLGSDADRYTASLQPVDKIHLYSHMVGEFEDNGDINYLYGLGTIAALILLIACINFMNLATARATKRMKEVGVRKTMGGSRIQLIAQFFGESLLMTVIAFVLGVGLVELLRPILNSFTGDQITNAYLGSVWFWSYSGGLILLVGLIAGSYPALYLSGFEPVSVLKKHSADLHGGALFRKILVVGQFAITVFLMVSTLVIYRQLEFLQDKQLGFSEQHVLTVPLRGLGTQSGYDRYKGTIEQSEAVLGVAASSNILMQGWHSGPIYLPDVRGRDNPVAWDFLHVVHDYPKVMDLKLVSGRYFSREYASDSSATILNESAVRALGMTNQEVLGTRIQNEWGVDGRVVGVAKDFHYASLHDQIQPFALMVNYDFAVRFLNIKIAANRIDETIGYLRSEWEAFAPESPFTYNFLDEQIGRLYQAEQTQGRLFANFTMLAIIISCLGLFGLASFMVEQRTREIGIRKVLGASVSGILGLLSKSFLRQVALGFVIGAPLAWYAMDIWLREFAYRTHQGLELFVVAGLITLSATAATVSWQSLRAALMNPVESLRSE